MQDASSSLCMLTSAMIPTFQELGKVFRSSVWQANPPWPTFAAINHSLPVECAAFAPANVCAGPRVSQTVASNSLICVLLTLPAQAATWLPGRRAATWLFCGVSNSKRWKTVSRTVVGNTYRYFRSMGDWIIGFGISQKLVKHHRRVRPCNGVKHDDLSLTRYPFTQHCHFSRLRAAHTSLEVLVTPFQPV